jgi:predicted DNA-binding WGR domain protein
MDQMRLKNSLSSNIIILYRKVNDRVRYYKVQICFTLFGEYLLICEWGNIDNKRSTGQKQNYFSSLSDLKDTIKKIIYHKSKRGYINSLTILRNKL